MDKAFVRNVDSQRRSQQEVGVAATSKQTTSISDLVCSVFATTAHSSTKMQVDIPISTCIFVRNVFKYEYSRGKLDRAQQWSANITFSVKKVFRWDTEVTF